MQLASLGLSCTWPLKGMAGLLEIAEGARQQEFPVAASPGASPPSALQGDVRLIGIGGAGRHFIDSHCQGFGWTLIAADRDDARPISATPAHERIVLTQRDVGIGQEAHWTATKHDATKLYTGLQGADVVIVVAGLGGRTGNSFAPAAASIARHLGTFTVGIGITPFEFEGHNRNVWAQEALAALRRHADVTIEISNQRQAEIGGPGMLLDDACMQAEEQAATFLARSFSRGGRLGPADVALTTPHDPV